MYKFIQKNQKKFLAVFGVLLMIVFILPTSFKNNLSRGEQTIGVVYGEKISGNELGMARNDLELLSQYSFPPLFELGGMPPGMREQDSIFARYFHGDDGALAYLLLQKEAQHDGFMISEQAADNLTAAAFRNMNLTQSQLEQISPAVGRFMLVQAEFERASSSVKPSKPVVEYYMSQAYQESKLNVVEFDAGELVKSVPPPTYQQILEQYEKYADVAPRPASLSQQGIPGYKVPERVKLQYLELPRAAVVDSVLGELSKDELFNLDVDAGYPYYQAHQADFAAPPPPTSRPAPGPLGPNLPTSNPATEPTSAPATAPAAPTTKPFEEVKEEIRRRLLTDATLSSSDRVTALRARVSALDAKLRSALHDELARDYAEWASAHAANPAGNQPTTPSTNPVVAMYPDLNFFTDFANKFEAQYKVRPLVNSLENDWLTLDELRELPGIGSAKAGDDPFAQYAMHDLAPTPTPTTAPTSAPTSAPASGAATSGPSASPDSSTAATSPTATASAPTTSPAEPSPDALTHWQPVGTGLRPYEPSALLEDSAGNAYEFRLTAFYPAHRPPLADVQNRIADQLTADAAYKLALEQANKLLENARIETKLRKDQKLPDQQGLPSAAKAAGKKLIVAGPFQPRSLFRTQQIPNLEVSDLGDRLALLTAVSKLAKDQTPQNPAPSALIELPAEHKVLVAEMGEATLRFPSNVQHLAEESVAPIAVQALERGRYTPTDSTPSDFLQDWFSLNDISARVKYVKARG